MKNHPSPFGYHDEDPALVAAAKRSSPDPDSLSSLPKRLKGSSTGSLLKYVPARLIKPEDLPSKRRRLEGYDS